jgi:hypothetical protein
MVGLPRHEDPGVCDWPAHCRRRRDRYRGAVGLTWIGEQFTTAIGKDVPFGPLQAIPSSPKTSSGAASSWVERTG